MSTLASISKKIASKSVGHNDLVKSRFMTRDIVNTITEVYQEHKHQAAPLAPQLMRSDINSTCHAIYKYVRSNVRYVEDKDSPEAKRAGTTDIQLVPSPAKLLAKGYGDCKGMSILCASILHSMGIECYFRYAKYPHSDTPNQYSHIYVIVPVSADRYVVLDPVYHIYGVEAPGASTYKDIKCTPSAAVAGGGDMWRQFTNWVGEKVDDIKDAGGQFRDWSKEKLGDVTDWSQEKVEDLMEWANDVNVSQSVKTVTLAPVRGSFLLLVRLNVLALADLLNVPSNAKVPYTTRARAKRNVDNVYTLWYKWGGKRTGSNSLASAVSNGAKERPFGTNLPGAKNFEFVKNLRSAGIISGTSSVGATGAEVAAALATATPFIVAIGGVLSGIALIVGVTKEDEDPIPTTPTLPTGTSIIVEPFYMTYQTELLAGGGLLAAYLLLKKPKTKRNK